MSKPHISATAVEAYKSILAGKQSQCVLISGESGAGKTDSTKPVLHVLTQAGSLDAAAPSWRRSVSEQIILGNPVLETFGNAKTQHNDNSSRFGKWIEVALQGKRIMCADVKTYLLGKSRVVGQTSGLT